jgi:RNA polymerase sigma-70 factor (ECF subfamily)
MNADDKNNPGPDGMSDAARLEEEKWMRSVVERFSGALTRYSASITRDVESARDVVQDAFFRLSREDRERVEDHLAPWLFRVCRNRALDHCRKEGRMRPLENAFLDEARAAGPSPAAEAERSDTAEQVFAVVEALPPNQREVVRLKFQNDLSYKEIAEATGLSVSNVGFLIHTALKNIRAEYGRLAG